jgi:hypothetical protein
LIAGDHRCSLALLQVIDYQWSEQGESSTRFGLGKPAFMMGQKALLKFVKFTPGIDSGKECAKVWVGRPEEEGPAPKVVGLEAMQDRLLNDLITSRLREAVRLFEIMKYRTKETKNLISQERKVEKGGKGAW